MARKRWSEEMAQKAQHLIDVCHNTLDTCEGCVAAGLDMHEEIKATKEQIKILEGLLKEFGPMQGVK